MSAKEKEEEGKKGVRREEGEGKGEGESFHNSLFCPAGIQDIFF